MNGRADVISVSHRPEAVLEALAHVKSMARMCSASAAVILLLKALLVVLAGAGLITVWFAAAFELIATLFVKIYSASAFEEKSLDRFTKKFDTKEKEKAD